MLITRGDHADTSKPLAGLALLTPQETEAKARHPSSSAILSFRFVFIAKKVVAPERLFLNSQHKHTAKEITLQYIELTIA